MSVIISIRWKFDSLKTSWKDDAFNTTLTEFNARMTIRSPLMLYKTPFHPESIILFRCNN